MRTVTQLSPPSKINMADKWFEFASLDHFWIRRRSEVFQSLWNGPVSMTLKIADIGCGHGVMLQQFFDKYSVAGDGFYENQAALNRANYSVGRLFYYNIHDRLASFKQTYDLIILF